MKTQEQMRNDIADWICNGQTADSYILGNASIHWVPGIEEYLLKLPDGTDVYDNHCPRLISMIDDEDIQAFYDDEELIEYYEENV